MKQRVSIMSIIGLCNVLQANALRFHGQFKDYEDDDIALATELEDCCKILSSLVRAYVKQVREAEK